MRAIRSLVLAPVAAARVFPVWRRSWKRSPSDPNRLTSKGGPWHLRRGAARLACPRCCLGKTVTIAFDGPGTVYSRCSLHPAQMQGEVVVRS
jgi:hypothetical protein